MSTRRRSSFVLVAALVVLGGSLAAVTRAQRGGGAPPNPGGGPATAPGPAPQSRPSGPDAPTPSSAPAARGSTTKPRDGATPDEPAHPATAPGSAERAAEYFAIADFDGNGWISFAEAQKSLGIDRGGFAVYDTDRDGRVDPEEFRVRYESILTHGGAFPPPAKKPEVRKPPRRDAAELLAAYDVTPDQALDAHELRRALDEYFVKDPPADKLLETLDRDASHALELSELDALSDVLSPPAAADLATKTKAQSVDELFGRTVARPVREGATHLPPQIPGPVPIFRRLDLNDDGGIQIDDLLELQRPVQLHVRVHAVFATLDLDGDGAISPEELAASMRPKHAQ